MASCKALPAYPPAPTGTDLGLMTESSGLPTGFPQSVDSPMAWEGSQFSNEDDYIVHLDEEDIQEAEESLKRFKVLGLDGDLISSNNFPLPRLGIKLRNLRRDVYSGRGFGIIRGLDPRKYSAEDLTMLHLGIQSYIANRHGRQDRKGNMLVHIIADNSSSLAAQHHRHSTSPITFHNEEAGDLVSWLTRSMAVSGGRCIIASCYTVYNVLASERPDLVRALAGADWPFSLPEFHCRPILFNHGGRLMMNFGRTPLTGSPAHPRPNELPPVSDRQLEALDAVEKVARATELRISTRAGDIHVINNLAMLHRREGFLDGATTPERRHLVRMRLRDDEMGWEIPPQLQPEWDKAFDTAKRSKVWHLEPMPNGYFPLRLYAN